MFYTYGVILYIFSYTIELHDDQCASDQKTSIQPQSFLGTRNAFQTAGEASTMLFWHGG